MKVLMLNGSAKANGNTFTALNEIGKQLNEEYGTYGSHGRKCHDFFKL